MADEGSAGNSGGGGLVIALAVVFVVGALAGGAFAIALDAPAGRSPPASVAAGKAGAGDGPDAAKRASGNAVPAIAEIVPLEPIIVNLLGEKSRWIRIEGSLGVAQPLKTGKDALLALIAEDIAGYLRGTPIKQLSSGSGIELMREDLTEIVQLRSEGAAQRFILRSLVIE